MTIYDLAWNMFWNVCVVVALGYIAGALISRKS